MKLRILVLMLGLLALAGCTRRAGDVTLVSTKNVAIERQTIRKVQGQDCVGIVIFIPLGIPNPEEAIDRALESASEADALADAVFYEDFWYIPYIYGEDCIRVEGDAVRIGRRLEEGAVEKPTAEPQGTPNAIPGAAGRR